MQTAARILTKAKATTKSFLTLQSFKERLLEKKINSFQPKAVFLEDHKNYRVMTASFPSDLKKILKLRHKIFVEDLGRESQNLEVDFDRYDLMGDHIMIVDQRNDKVIGTYRVICSRFTNSFYSESEFNMSDLKAQSDCKLELGRACIHPDYRNGVTLHLIWKGLARYIKLVEARYLFGCSSIFTMKPDEIQNVLHQFKDEQWGKEFSISPKAKYKYPNLDFKLAEQELTYTPEGKLIPPLLQGYLRAGAKVYGQPALDRQFGCIDVFTVLDMKNISKQYRAKYFDT